MGEELLINNQRNKIEKKQRNSAIELLRLVAIFFIVLSHYSVHGSLIGINLPISFNRYLLEIVSLGNLGVVIFILISGYFLINSNFNWKRLLQLILEVWFYSFFIYVIMLACGQNQFNLRTFIKCFFPTLFNQYWFFTAYIVLYILSPFINKLIKAMDRKNLVWFIVTMLILWSIVFTFTSREMYGEVPCEFLMFYTIGAYLKLYPNNKFMNKKYLVMGVVISSFLLMLSVFTIMLLGEKISIFKNRDLFFYNRKSILTIILAVSIFGLFINIKPFTNKVINVLASSCFGVYLIHDQNEMRQFIWKTLFNNSEYINSNILLVHMILSVVIVFISCIIIELIRKYTIEKGYMMFIDKINYKVKEKNFIKKY